MPTLGRHPGHARLLSKLATTTALSEDDLAALVALPVTVRDVGADADLIRQGERPAHCTLLLEGFACRYKLADDGRRQILSLHVPSDMPDVQSLHTVAMDHGLATLRPSRVASIAHNHLVDLMSARPAVAAALWRETLVDAAIYREWLFGLGRREAIVRLAHLVSETVARFRSVDLPNQAAALPLKQIQLADALGLSPVHVNRVLKELRERRLLGPGRSAIEVRDRLGLAELCGFNDGYLHLRAA
ncbi:Crp/Fnr family transcriptional regulator [Phenylobacterium sp. VNQ135]|uniref:Crp/Fnr family transcriptional regulator n=1 Tax=Phenylobacterium sp. VNQ135 TaxID=3400922 RepID=UPI003C0FA56D